jgi:probable HAF family extracellular repeat protein
MQRLRRTIGITVLSVTALVAFGARATVHTAASGVGPGSYTVADLGDFGGGESEAYDINASGQVTGQAYDAAPENWAFLYGNGVLTNLGAPRGNNPNGTPAYAGIASSGWAVNALGQVTGMYLYCPFNVICQPAQHPFLYSNGSIIDIGSGLSGAGVAINDVGDVAGSLNVTGGSHGFLYSGGVTTDFGALTNLPYASSTAINHSRQIVGFSTKPYPNYLPHAFLYSNGTMTDVTPGGGDAWAINDAGQMTGFYYTSGGITYHAYIYSSANGAPSDPNAFTDLGSLNGDSGASRAYAINAAGQVTGVTDVPNPYGASHAFLYSNGTMIDLGSLGGSSSWPGNDFYDHAINASGQVVGTSYLAGDRATHAFLYREGDPVMTDLNSLIPSDSGWTLQVANAVNDNGQITGYGLINGQTHAFLLTPAAGTATLKSIAVTPVNPSISVGSTQAFAATGTYSDSSTADLTNSATWSSGTLSVATIAAGGLATGVGAGTSLITATSGGVSGSTTLTVIVPPTITKVFGSSAILLGGSTTLTFNIANPNATTALTGVGFTDLLPSGLIVATPNGLTASCGTVSAVAGSSTITLTNGYIPANTNCGFSVTVIGQQIGALTNVTGNVTSTEAGAGGTATASITVQSPPPNCVGQQTLALAKLYGGLKNAAAARGFSSVAALQASISKGCGQ